MKITENTTNHLVIDDRPIAMGLFIVGCILGLLALALRVAIDLSVVVIVPLLGALGFAMAFAVFVRRTEIRFDRTAQIMSIRTTTLRATTARSIPLAEIARVAVESRQGTSGKRNRPVTLSRPVLHLVNDEVLPLNEVYVGGPAARHVADAVGAWLTHGR